MTSHAFWCPLETRGGTCTCTTQPAQSGEVFLSEPPAEPVTRPKGPDMDDHAELAEKALAAAQAVLDPTQPDPAELALCAAAHWLGSIDGTLREIVETLRELGAPGAVYRMHNPYDGRCMFWFGAAPSQTRCVLYANHDGDHDPGEPVEDPHAVDPEDPEPEDGLSDTIPRPAYAAGLPPSLRDGGPAQRVRLRDRRDG